MNLNKQEGDLGDRVDRLMRMLQEVSEGMTLLSQEIAEMSGLHITDVGASSVLSRHREEPMTIGALREHLGLSPAAMTKLVDRLEDAGHVRRVPDARDRRRVCLEVTAKADALAKDVLSQFLGGLQGELNTYDDASLAAAERFLSDVRDALPGGVRGSREPGNPAKKLTS
jgi:DNA-binding MarR family transcriptional regulator